MNRKVLSLALSMACLLGAAEAQAFTDLKVDLTNGNLLTADEIANKSLTTMGVAVAADGTVSRTAADDASAVATLTGKYHSNEHGWGNFSSTIAVEGPVKVSMGTCAWGGDVTVKDASGTVVATFNTNTGACYHNDKAANIASGIYKGGATTLTISGGSYTPYFAVEAVDPSTLTEDVKVTYSLGTYTEAGQTLPAEETVEVGKTITIPANFTLYVEGKTLTGWTDGTNTYQIGEVVTVNEAMTLTPVFVDNAVSLADRTAETTVKWDFQRKNGAPTVGYQNKTGWWVAQAMIGTEVIDVKLDFDTNNGGKLANGNWNDWARMNGGTTFQVPSCKGATISYESYSATTTTTIDGIVVENGGSTVSTFTVASPSEFVPLVIGDGSYYRWIQVVLPVVQQAGGQSFDNANAEILYPFNSANYMDGFTSTPEGAFSVVTFDLGDNNYKKTMTTTMCPDVTFVDFNSTNGADDLLKWVVKPATGVTFTPTKIEFYVGRDGTDGAVGCVHVKGQTDGAEVEFDAITPHRNNKSQADDKWGNEASYTTHYSRELTAAEQQQLASATGFNLVLNNGFANNKGLLISDVRIYGTVNGTAVSLPKYTLTAKANPEEGANITIYPNLEEFEEGSEVTLTATKNFGFTFVNWTDAEGTVVSTDAKFTYVVNSNAELTANLNPVTTYELQYAAEGGANAYQIQANPAPTMVDGKMMYEEGTKVTLTAISNPLVTFTNWSDGQTLSEITFTMDGDKLYTATFSAIDFLAGWDFYNPGNNGRPADFYSADNDAAQLILRDAEGNTQGWLDKAQTAGGYEGRPGGVNWRTDGLGKWYWQTTVNGEAFTDIKVQGAMVYNYNAYTTYNVEASLDGETWEKIGDIAMEGPKNWKDYEYALPETYNNKANISIRWIADKNSPVDGTSSNNDGACIGATYITGTAKLVNDGTAPVLVNFVPEEGTANASINGKIVLTYDEKVKTAEGVKATLGEQTLEPTVSGKTVMFNYKNLTYATDYTFTLPAGAVMDLCDNATDKEVKINFTTRTKPEVAKALYNFVVPDDGTFKEAINAANTREDKNKRYIIFVKKGTYELPWDEEKTVTNNGVTLPSPITYLNAPNTSIIGEDRDQTVIVNLMKDLTPEGVAYPIEGLHNVTTLYINKGADNTYIQDITLKNGMNDATGRGEAIEDNANKTICKNVKLLGYQDTYCSNNGNGRYYFEGGYLRGCTDFLCGKGDIFFNGVTLAMCEAGGYLAVPSTPKQYGYIFKDCEIIGEKSDINGRYTLGRPWGSGTPIALYIDTRMVVQPSAIGWNEMSGGWPKRFAEYNSVTENGTVIDLKDRKKSFGDENKSGVFPNDPVLTHEEAEFHSLAQVLGGDDEWDPTLATEQAPQAANVKCDGSVLTWDASQYASLWAICADGEVIDFTTENSYSLSAPAAVAAQDKADAKEIEYSVRAANEMGGLGEAVVAGNAVSISDIVAGEVVSVEVYNLQGIRVDASAKGLVIKVTTYADGTKTTVKEIVK